MKPYPAAPGERRPSQVEGGVPNASLYCALLTGGQERARAPLGWLGQVQGHLLVSEAGVATAPTVHTVSDSEQPCVVPRAHALGSLVQVSLP